MPDLKVADLIKDQSLLEIARNEAEQLLQEDKNLSLHPKTRASLENFWKGKTEIFMTA